MGIGCCAATGAVYFVIKRPWHHAVRIKINSFLTRRRHCSVEDFDGIVLDEKLWLNTVLKMKSRGAPDSSVLNALECNCHCHIKGVGCFC